MALLFQKNQNLPMVELKLANGSIYPEKRKIEVTIGQIDATTGTIQFRVGFPNPQIISNGNSGTIRFLSFMTMLCSARNCNFTNNKGIVYLFKVEKILLKFCNRSARPSIIW